MFQKSFNDSAILYLVATPIGNMEDITFRAIKILKEVDIIFCEDTRISKKLLNHYDISKKLIPAYDQNETKVKDLVLFYLSSGKSVALISDAGTPMISDPGFKITRHIINAGFNVVSIPGASSFISGLIVSGIEPYPFLFYGFLSNKSGKKGKQLEELKYQKNTLIFYEAPHRLEKTLNEVKKRFGNRKICVARELTKRFEEIFRGTINEYQESSKTLKGEIVLIIEGTKEKTEIDLKEVKKEIDLCIKKGYTQTESIKLISEQLGVSKNKIYNEYHRK